MATDEYGNTLPAADDYAAPTAAEELAAEAADRAYARLMYLADFAPLPTAPGRTFIPYAWAVGEAELALAVAVDDGSLVGVYELATLAARGGVVDGVTYARDMGADFLAEHGEEIADALGLATCPVSP